MDKKGQANIIAAIGLIAAVVFAVLNLINYISNIGLSSTIQVTAQQSIYSVLSEKDYVLQQANYKFDEAEVLAGFLLNPDSGGINCGYINTTSVLPFIPVPKIYYWHTLSG